MKQGIVWLPAVAASLLVLATACSAGDRVEQTSATPVPSPSPSPLPVEPVSDVDAWTVVELSHPGSSLIGEVIGLSVRSGRSRAIAYAGGAGLDGERLLAWESIDGQDWRLVSEQGAPLPAGSRFLMVDSGGAGHVGIHRDRFEMGERPAVWSSPDGSSWAEGRLPLDLGEHDRFIVRDIVATDHAFVVVGTVWTHPPEAQANLSGGDRNLTLAEGWWVVTDASGQTVGEGPLTDIYPVEVLPDGATVVDPASGEVLVVIPWDVYETERIQTGPVTAQIDHDGWRLLEDESDNTYAVIDLATGEEVVRGASQYRLTFGADPQVILDDGHRVSMTWEELELAWSEGLALAVASPIEERMVTVAFVSVGNGGWEPVEIGMFDDDVVEVDVYWVTGEPGGDGLVAAGANIRFDEELGQGTPVWTTWTSTDGTRWAPVEVEIHGGLYADAVSSGDDGVLVGGHDGLSRYLATSTDGRSWEVEFEVEEAHLDEWMSDVAVSGWISAAVGGSESPRGTVAELFVRRAGTGWERADLPEDPLALHLTELAVTSDELIVGGSIAGSRGRGGPALLVLDRSG